PAARPLSPYTTLFRSRQNRTLTRACVRRARRPGMHRKPAVDQPDTGLLHMGQHYIRMLMTPNTSASPVLPPDDKVSAWNLIKPYWVSEERKTAWGLLVAIIVMN